MSIQSYAQSVGYENLDQVARRTVWTCGALTVGSLIGPVFFKNFNIKAHVLFGVVEGASINLIVHNSYLPLIEGKLVEFDSEREDMMKRIARIMQFSILCSVSLLLAKNITSWFFQKITHSHMLKVGVFYNGAIGVASAYTYEAWKDS